MNARPKKAATTNNENRTNYFFYVHVRFGRISRHGNNFYAQAQFASSSRWNTRNRKKNRTRKITNDSYLVLLYFVLLVFFSLAFVLAMPCSVSVAPLFFVFVYFVSWQRKQMKMTAVTVSQPCWTERKKYNIPNYTNSGSINFPCPSCVALRSHCCCYFVSKWNKI